MIIKYNRTSTIQQKGERFKLDKENYDKVLFDYGVSGKIPFNKRTQAIKLINLIEEGKVETVVVEDLSRLGRNTIDTLTTLKYFEDKNVNVKVNSLNIQSIVDNKKNPVWNILTSVMSTIYELERENILERTRLGREAYIKNGGKIGRPKNSNESDRKFLNKDRSQNIKSLLQKGKSVRDIAARLKCSTTTVMKVKKLIS